MELTEGFKLLKHIVFVYLQDSITVLGQICCDSNGKLNAQSVLLEAGPEQGGQQVPVNLSELKEYSLFPGQVSKGKLMLCYNVYFFNHVLNNSVLVTKCPRTAVNNTQSAFNYPCKNNAESCHRLWVFEARSRALP